MGKALDLLRQLEVKEFDWKQGPHDIGLIAEEVEKVIPEAVWYGHEGKIEGLKPLTLIAIIIEAIKELKEEK
jgi:hypothetical protein